MLPYPYRQYGRNQPPFSTKHPGRNADFINEIHTFYEIKQTLLKKVLVISLLENLFMEQTEG
jgi:hypothetical protein